MHDFHVSIIGAGLGGLCLAQALHRAGVAFDVYERDPAPDSRLQGYRIRIDADGQRALAGALSPPRYRLFRETASIATSAARFLTPQLTPIAGHAPDSWRADDGDGDAEGADLGVNRQTLRDILMAGIEARIHFDHAFDTCSMTDDGRVAVGFRHRRAPVMSHVLVGADGVNSHVRALLAPAAEPQDSGSLCIYGKTALPEPASGAGSGAGTRVIVADGCTAILDEMRFRAALPVLASRLAPECVLTPSDDYLYWALIGPRERFGQPVGDDPRARLRKVVRGWHPALQDVVLGSDPAAVAMLPVRSGRPEVEWPAGPVTLLGDAIHAMSPAGGLGANTALRDAIALADALVDAATGRSTTALALAGYEARMRSWAVPAVAMSRQGAARLSAPAPADASAFH